MQTLKLLLLFASILFAVSCASTKQQPSQTTQVEQPIKTPTIASYEIPRDRLIAGYNPKVYQLELNEKTLTILSPEGIQFIDEINLQYPDQRPFHVM